MLAAQKKRSSGIICNSPKTKVIAFRRIGYELKVKKAIFRPLLLSWVLTLNNKYIELLRMKVLIQKWPQMKQLADNYLHYKSSYLSYNLHHQLIRKL